MAAFRKALGGMRPKIGNLSRPIKDTEDQLMKIFHRDGTQFMKDLSDFHTIIGMRVASIPGVTNSQSAGTQSSCGSGCVGMTSSQDAAGFNGNLAQQGESMPARFGPMGFGINRRREHLSRCF